jgi:hypothetical protein
MADSFEIKIRAAHAHAAGLPALSDRFDLSLEPVQHHHDSSSYGRSSESSDHYLVISEKVPTLEDQQRAGVHPSRFVDLRGAFSKRLRLPGELVDATGTTWSQQAFPSGIVLTVDVPKRRASAQPSATSVGPHQAQPSAHTAVADKNDQHKQATTRAAYKTPDGEKVHSTPGRHRQPHDVAMGRDDDYDRIFGNGANHQQKRTRKRKRSRLSPEAKWRQDVWVRQSRARRDAQRQRRLEQAQANAQAKAQAQAQARAEAEAPEQAHAQMQDARKRRLRQQPQQQGAPHAHTDADEIYYYNDDVEVTDAGEDHGGADGKADASFGSIFSGFWDNRGDFHYWGAQELIR